MNDWHQHWFNEDYLKLYAGHDAAEAAAQAAFVLKATQLRTGRVLDLGCGSGRHAAVFAKAGFEVVAVDGSETLINEAKKRVNLPIKWVLADFRNLPDIGTFDLILSMFTSFGYFDTDAENEEILRIISRKLKKDGRFFLDFLDPRAVREGLVLEDVQVVDNMRIITKKQIVGDQVVKTIEFPEKTYVERVKLYEKAQIEAMALESGLQMTGFWRGYNPQILDRQLFLFSRI